MRRCLLLLLVACQGPSSEGGPATADSGPSDPDAPRYHADVAPILARSCLGCHEPGGIGTPTWSSPEEIASWAPAIGAAVESGTMPPWQANRDCTNYVGDFSLTDDEIRTLVDWAEGGAPLGDPVAGVSLPEPFSPPALERVDEELVMAEPYTPSASPDDYRCFLLDWPYAADAWVTGFDLLPGNKDIVHHIIPFIIDGDDAAQYRALDEADPGAGYHCFGGPGGDIQTLIRTRWLGSWAPGSGAVTLPEGTGIRVSPGSLIAFQVHYNTASTDPAPDQSGIALQIETERQAWADLQPWTEVSWVLGNGMDIPPNSEGVTHSFEYTASRDERFTMHSASLHMHELGRSARFDVQRADGTEECLLAIDNWDFNWQRSYHLEAPVEIRAGDTVRLSCTWDNPTDELVKWGEGTGDEMCLGVALLTD